MYLITNIAAYSAGKPLVHFFTQPFWSYIIALGGGGATLGLCILLVRSKSVELRTLGKLSIGPAFFNINEPIIFWFTNGIKSNYDDSIYFCASC